MRQKQLKIEINKRMEVYKDNNEIYQYLNILLNRLKNVNEVNNVQRDLTELENCYEKKQIALELVYLFIYLFFLSYRNKFYNLYDYLNNKHGSIDLDVKKYYNTLKSKPNMFDLSNNTLDLYEEIIEDIKNKIKNIKQNMKIYQIRMLIAMYDTQILYYVAEYNQYSDNPIQEPQSLYTEFLMSQSIYRAQDSDVKNKLIDSINRFDTVYESYHRKVIELQENIVRILDSVRTKYKNNINTISKFNNNLLSPTFYQDFTNIINNPSNKLSVCFEQYRLSQEYYNNIDSAINQYYSEKTATIKTLERELASLAEQVPILRNEYNRINFSIESQNTQSIADLEQQLANKKKEFIMKRDKYYNESLTPYYISMYSSLYRQNYNPNIKLPVFVNAITKQFNYERYKQQSSLFRFLYLYYYYCDYRYNEYLPCTVRLFQLLHIKDEKRLYDEIIPKLYNMTINVDNFNDKMIFYQNLLVKWNNYVFLYQKFLEKKYVYINLYNLS